jgi:hypothetical protein
VYLTARAVLIKKIDQFGRGQLVQPRNESECDEQIVVNIGLKSKPASGQLTMQPEVTNVHDLD